MVTRGYGVLEEFLASLRAKKADSLIPEHLRSGKIVDIGCGTTPYFLANTTFSKKIGIDTVRTEDFLTSDGITLKSQDFFNIPELELESASVSVVAMLAVFEHIEAKPLEILLRETHRILIPGGHMILTVPAGWTDPILKFLAQIRLLSATEVFDHKDTYSKNDVVKHLVQAGFPLQGIEAGYFELGMNIWCAARKQS